MQTTSWNESLRIIAMSLGLAGAGADDWVKNLAYVAEQFRLGNIGGGGTGTISPVAYNTIVNNTGLYSPEEVVVFDHTPTQEEISALPPQCLVTYPGSTGPEGPATVITDGVTVLGDGSVAAPLRAPRQGAILRGPYADVASVPTPYDSTALYMVGDDTAGYELYIVGADGVLHEASSGGGSVEPPANMVTTDTAQTITGVKSFQHIVMSEPSANNTAIVDVAAPSADTDAANKQYVDTIGASAISAANSYTDTTNAATLTSAEQYTDTATEGILAEASAAANTAIQAALTESKSYTDQVAATTLTDAKDYTDSSAASTLTAANTYTDNADIANLAAAKSYTDTTVAAEAATTLAEAKAYTDQTAAANPQMQEPEEFTYTGSTTFTVSKSVAWISQIFVFNGSTSFYLLHKADYSVAANKTDVTINNPTLTDGMTLTIQYAS